ncbi:MAG: cryptochrome/photolyase family protein [Sediminibacterium sp.]|jgi:deoxyribodipyrimidine photo-lyase|nr:deoxyribodipyrimidine photo-lyase [Chitinophagaceae bacterium]MCA6447055.1 deoxyribodipyrimidine photo-lyase [Chitinophagaceae bacterium]
MKKEIVICWFRRDLRLEDNAALYHALKSGYPVLPVFIFDKNILNKLENKSDRRVEFIHAALHDMQKLLQNLGSTMAVFYDYPLEAYQKLFSRYIIKAVYTNHDYEPYAVERDTLIKDFLQQQGAHLFTYKDQVIFEKDEVVKDDGKPYTVFSPYARKWRALLTPFYLKAYPTEKYFSAFLKQEVIAIPSLASMGFKAVDIPFPTKQLEDDIIQHYTKNRDYPALEKGTSKMGVHLRFGTVSIRALGRRALTLNDTYLNELIWRDFYHAILWHFPKVGRGASFKAEYEKIEWINNENEFKCWCEGNTGYPIVDAGMRELNATGYMHNRVRMIVASFLTKHLLIDWRWGEAYFAEKLLDFDLAANNGGWQWASSSGCDAAPYFRVFNPYLQTEKFDKELKYVKKWVPEFMEFSYPKPIVPHEAARKRVLEVYAKALKE